MEIVKPTSEKDPEAKIRELLVEIGVDPEEIAPRIMARLVLLNESTETINDGKSSIKTARSIFGYYEREKPDKTFSDIEKKTVLVGTFFSDIGKTGPANATLDQQKLIIEMYRVENVVDTAMSVRDFLKTYFSDVEERVKRFQGMGLVLNFLWVTLPNRSAEFIEDRGRGFKVDSYNFCNKVRISLVFELLQL